jgi:hypothetical protein
MHGMKLIGLSVLFVAALDLTAAVSASAQVLQNMGVPPQVFPGPIYTAATAINNNGLVLGVSFNGLDELPMYSTGGGTFTTIGPSTNVDDGFALAINSSGTAIVTINNDNYLYNIPTNTLTDVSPSIGAAIGLSNYPLVLDGINDSGQIIGIDGSTYANSFIYSNGSASLLPNVIAEAINLYLFRWHYDRSRHFGRPIQQRWFH